MAVSTLAKDVWRPHTSLVVASGIITLLIFLFLVYGDEWLGRPHVHQFNSAEILDTRLRYNIEDVRRMLQAFGREGAETYKRVYTDGFDMIYPFAYGTFMTTLILQAQIPNHPLSFISYFPAITAGLDLLENICHYIILEAYLMGDQQLEGKDAVRCAWLSGGIFTPAKWFFATISILYWVYLIVWHRCACTHSKMRLRPHVD
jgi:hypothetical protein